MQRDAADDQAMHGKQRTTLELIRTTMQEVL